MIFFIEPFKYSIVIQLKSASSHFFHAFFKIHSEIFYLFCIRKKRKKLSLIFCDLYLETLTAYKKESIFEIIINVLRKVRAENDAIHLA